MGGNDNFPWESLKADCLRLVCSQLAEGSTVTSRVFGKKEDMVEFLRDVNDRGVEAALEGIEQNYTARAPSIRTPQTSHSKRRSSHLGDDEDAEGESNNEEGYNTRYKGVKRVKVTEYTPEPERAYDPKPRPPRKTPSPRKGEQTSYRGRGRPRKSDAPVSDAYVPEPAPSRGRGRPRKSDIDNRRPSKAGEKAAGDDKPKRGRGRPRKSETAHPGEGTKPESQGKQVFVGVVLQTRAARTSYRQPEGQDMDTDPKNQDDDGEDEEDAVLRAVNGNVSGDLSSLGSSNKENQPLDHGDSFETGDADADGDIDADIAIEV